MTSHPLSPLVSVVLTMGRGGGEGAHSSRAASVGAAGEGSQAG